MSQPLHVLFSGDLSFSGIFKTKVNANQTVFSDGIRAALKSADFVVANLEGPVTSETLSAQTAVDLRQPPNTIAYLKQRCNPVLNLANNHTLDCGQSGLQETVKTIESADAHSFGIDQTAAIQYLSSGELKIALIAILLPGAYAAATGAESVFTFSNSKKLKSLIKKASEKADWVILNIHGGEEYTRFPSPPRRKLLRRLAALNGVDIIIAHHSHVFQGIETVQKTLIFHSLGNFVFHITKHGTFPATKKSALVQFQFSKESFRYDLLPTKADLQEGRIREGEPMFLEEIKHRSNFTAYYKKWRREAHAVLYATAEQSPQVSGLRGQAFYQLLFSGNFYKKGFKIITDAQKRSLYFGALLYRLLQKAGFNK